VRTGAEDDYKGAIEDLTKAIDLGGATVEAWATRGSARELLGDRDGAIADFKRFLELGPENPLALEVRGRLEALQAAPR
jgi:regulator of sirC expression with transglutaminase-like and TPR domain